MNNRTPWLALLFISSAALLATPVMAQVTTPATPAAPTGFWLTTPFPALTLPAGQTGDIPLTLKNSGLPPQRAELSVTGLPAGWTSKLTGDGNDISAVMVGNDDSESVTLGLTPPKGANSGTYKFEVDARYGSATAALPISVTLSGQKPGGLELDPQLPALRGSPTTTFDYQVKVTNNGAKDALFNLSAKLPDGFTASFKHGYDTAEITGVPIKAGANDSITLEVKANPSVTAGRVGFYLEGDRIIGAGLDWNTGDLGGVIAVLEAGGEAIRQLGRQVEQRILGAVVGYLHLVVEGRGGRAPQGRQLWIELEAAGLLARERHRNRQRGGGAAIS